MVALRDGSASGSWRIERLAGALDAGADERDLHRARGAQTIEWMSAMGMERTYGLVRRSSRSCEDAVAEKRGKNFRSLTGLMRTNDLCGGLAKQLLVAVTARNFHTVCKKFATIKTLG
jgi:hypothetical protein